MFQKKEDTQHLSVKEWFIRIENHQEGPYDLRDLKSDHRFTPDTLVWKEGFKEWVPARFVFDMQEIFKDESEPQALHETPKQTFLEPNLGQQEQASLTIQQDPYPLLLLLLLVLMVILSTFYQLYYT